MEALLAAGPPIGLSVRTLERVLISSSTESSSIASSLPDASLSVPTQRGLLLLTVRSSSSSSSSENSESEAESSSNPSISTSIQTGIAALAAMKARTHHGKITYPRFNPQLKVAPPRAGPAALPRAENVVANPFRVPRILNDVAEFVMRIVLHGNENIDAMHFNIIIPNITHCCIGVLGRSAVKGVKIYAIGYKIVQIFKQFKIPSFRATGGKTKN